MTNKICMNFVENKDIRVGDKVIIQLPHEDIEREFVVIQLDKFKNLPVIEYNGKELLIDRRMIKGKVNS